MSICSNSYLKTKFQTACIPTQQDFENLIDSSGGTWQNKDGTLDLRVKDEGSVSGNIRGNNSIDLQTARNNADQVATANFSSILGGCSNKTQSCYSVIVNGCCNAIQSNTPNSFIGSGAFNKIGDEFLYGGGHSSIIGGYCNYICEPNYSFIGGGYCNIANSISVVITGGYCNKIICCNNTPNYSFIGGGACNTIQDASDSSIIGGIQNSILTSLNNHVIGSYNTLCGSCNTIMGSCNSICYSNSAGNSIIGNFNTIACTSGSSFNTVNGCFNTICSSNNSTILGGQNVVSHDNVIMISDGTTTVNSAGNCKFHIMSSCGGVIWTDNTLTTGVCLAASAGSWSSLSDRNVKNNINPVNYDNILSKVNQLEISEWNFINQNNNIKHIGPMAQDFNSLFSFSESDRYINNSDVDGVLFASIKGLIKHIDRLNNEIQNLKEQINIK